MQQKQSKGKAGQTATELRIDADFYAYKACAANEVDLDWGADLVTIHSHFPTVTNTFTSFITSLKDRFDTDQVVLYFSGSDNFRKTIDPEYKGSRSKRKPVGYSRLLQWCFENFNVVRFPNIEADDALGISCHNDTSNFVLVSPDKDMRQIACRLFDGENEIEVSEEDADRWFWTQVLTGDQVDGYKGVPGVGPVKAKAILDKADDPWTAIVQAYEKAGLSVDDAIRNARLARILRPGEYDLDLYKPILWTPN